MTDPISDSTPMNEPGRAILYVCITCGVLETLAVALRFLARRKMKARLQIDDWLIFASLWPNYAMIVTGGFCKQYLTNIALLGIDFHSGWRRQSRVANRLPDSSPDGPISSGKTTPVCL